MIIGQSLLKPELNRELSSRQRIRLGGGQAQRVYHNALEPGDDGRAG